MSEPVATTARTARLSLPYLFPGQAQKEAFVNEALARLDALIAPAVLGESAAPPAAPQPGECYLVAASPSGAWAGHARAIACWAQSQWLFTEARPGLQVHDLAAGALAVFDPAAGWQRAAAPAAPAGGAVQDAEARAALAAVVAGLRATGIFA